MIGMKMEIGDFKSNTILCLRGLSKYLINIILSLFTFNDINLKLIINICGSMWKPQEYMACVSQFRGRRDWNHPRVIEEVEFELRKIVFKLEGWWH